MSILPLEVRQVLGVLSEGQGRRVLAERSSVITAGYKARQNSNNTLLTAEDALAYALARMPATFAATAQALERVVEVLPDFVPKSLLDVGCGPGTASFATREQFSNLADITLLDRNGPFLTLAKTLSETALPDAIVTITAQDIVAAKPLPKADLVIASYVLAELKPDAQATLIQHMWDATNSLLLLVEPGTPDGFQRLREARTSLVQQGAIVAAPCTHENACMMAGQNWCRFLARVQRSRDHKALKGATVPYEDETYAYLAVTREKLAMRPSQRIVGRVSENKYEIRLPVCGTDGLSTLTVPTRQKELFKQFRRLDWGDAVLNLIQDAEAVGKE
jgi:ribosomal protein RSM22 (predicted rRNA methylase)